MPKPVAEVGEGHEDASGNGVYCFIRDLIVEGRDARFVDKKGRYVINWSRALECYHDYKSRRNPQYKSKNISRRKASNGLRAALLNFYKKEGAKEYGDCRKVNEKDEVVERQFQMPPRMFESLFGSNVQLSDDSSECETSSITSEADKNPLATLNSSDTGFDEAMDISDDAEPNSGGLPTDDPHCSNARTEDDQDLTTLSQILDISDEELLDSALEEIFSNSDKDIDLLGVVCGICPSSGSVKGGLQFQINLTEELSEDAGIAHFEGIGDVCLERLNYYTLVGILPASQQAGLVHVTVSTQDGHLLGRTEFLYVNETLEVLEQLVNDPALQTLYFAMWSKQHGSFGSNSILAQNLDPFTLQDKGSSIQGTHAQTLKVLQLLVYTAAQTNAQQFIQMIFSTSAGRLVFNAYKDRAQLPEDVARANGHDDLAQYLKDVNARLSKENSNDAQPSSIDWLELIEAVNKIQEQSFVVEDETDLEVGQSKDDDNESDYFADAETSSCGSFELEFGWSDSEDGEEPCSKGGGSDKEPDVKSASSMNVMQWEAYAEVETQSDSDLDLEDDESYEEPGTVNSKPTLNLRSGTFRQLRKWRRACVKEVCEIQSSSQKIEVATQKRENTSEREQEAKACIGKEKWMQLKLRSGTFRQLRKWRRASVKEVCEVQSSSQKIGVATKKRENTSKREQEAKACIGQEKWMQLKSPFSKDERPKKEPDERLTQKNSMERRSCEVPPVLGTNLDNELNRKAGRKNDRKLFIFPCGNKEVGKSCLMSKLSKKVAVSGREEEEARTAPGQEQTTRPKTTKPCTMSFSSERPVTNNNLAQSGIQNQLSKGILTQQEYTIIPNCGRNRELGELQDHAVNSEEIPKDDQPTLERHISSISTVSPLGNLEEYLCQPVGIAWGCYAICLWEPVKTLYKLVLDVTSRSFAIKCSSTRWSRPGVILERNCYPDSRVYGFGISAWELHSAFDTGQEKRGYSLPYCDLAINQILPHIRDIGPLTKPEGWPDWVYIIMHQCGTCDPLQRPPVIAIFDRLTSRQPMKSWMMSLWLEKHEKIEWPDLAIGQLEEACHLSLRDRNYIERVIKEMCSEGFFIEHGYRYVQWDATAERVPEQVYDDVEGKDCTQNSSYLQNEELYEKADDVGCQIVQIDVTETKLQEEELCDDVRGTTLIKHPKNFNERRL